MGHGKETPRQKMIGMMYLVLTALLALNVAKSILDAFIVVNAGLAVTNSNFDAKNGKLYTDFGSALAANKVKVQPFYDAAEKAKKLSEEMDEYIHELKKELIIAVDQCEEDVAEKACMDLDLVTSRDNYDIPTNALIPEPAMPDKGKAHELKLKLVEFRENMISLLEDKSLNMPTRDKIIADLGNLGINTDVRETDSDDPADKSWESQNFYHCVIVATITIMTKIQNDVKNAESEIVTTLLSQVDASDFKFDEITAKIIPKSSYVLRGDQYEAEMFVAAYSTTENPIIIVGEEWDSNNFTVTGDTTMIPVKDGMGKYTVDAVGEGMKKFSAMIKLKKPGTDGSKPSDWVVYPIKNQEYQVAPPSVVVSPTKMNVLYRGIDNPLAVSAAGMSAKDISASGSNVTLKMTKAGEYIARPGKGNIAKVSVTAKVDGANKTMGAPVEFRVKNVPDPVAKIGGETGGVIKRKKLLLQKGVDAVLENFAFDLVFNVVTFKLVYQDKSGLFQEMKVSGSRFDSKQKKALKSMKPNQRVMFEGIKAKGPDGTTRKLPSISFKIIA